MFVSDVFSLILISFHIASLLYALVLCMQTHHIDDDFAESNNIAQAVAFMFQVLVLSIPVAILVEDSNDVFYFVLVCAVFLQNFTLLTLLFVPKMIKTASGQGDVRQLVAVKKESIPMFALTHCKWDEGVDMIHILLDDCDSLTNDHREKLIMVKSLLLKASK